MCNAPFSSLRNTGVEIGFEATPLFTVLVQKIAEHIALDQRFVKTMRNDFVEILELGDLALFRGEP